MIWRVLGAAMLAAAAVGAQVVVGGTSGLNLRIYDTGNGRSKTGVPGPDQLPNVDRVLKSVDLNDERPDELGGLKDNFLAILTGTLIIDQEGQYDFRLTSDDGSVLLINSEMAIDNDGLHGAEPKETTAYLPKGRYPLEVRWFEAGGGAELKLEWKKPGGDWEILPEAATVCPTGILRKTAPGPKQIVDAPATGADADPNRQRGIHPGYTLVPGRPDAYRPKVIAVTSLPDGRPIVLDATSRSLVWVSAGVPPQVLADNLTDPLGVTVVGDKVYLLTSTALMQLTWVRRDWQSTLMAMAPAGERFVAGPAALGKSLVVAAGKTVDKARLLSVDAATKRQSLLLAEIAAPVALAARGNDLLAVQAVDDSSSKVVAVSRMGNAWKAGLPVWLPVASKPGRPIGVAVLGDALLVGDGVDGLLRVTAGPAGGAAFHHSTGFESSPRAVGVKADGSVLVGCDSTKMLGRPFGLQKLEPKPGSVFDLLAVTPKANGLELSFNEPLAAGAAWDHGLYALKSAEGKALTIASASYDAGKKSVFLEVPGLTAGRYQLTIGVPLPQSEAQHALWTREAWLSVGALPKDAGKVVPAPDGVRPNTLTQAEQAAGWKLLFDGKSAAAWRGWKRTDMPAGWTVENGWLKELKGGGDIISRDAYENFELAMDVVMTPGCNSGIMYRVTEEIEPSFMSGPEIQIQADGVPDSREIHSAGALYEMYPPNEQKHLEPPFVVNHYLLRLDHNKAEHWLNGKKIVEYTVGSDDWLQRFRASKFKDSPKFGTEARGHLVLQDHGTVVWFRNIKIHELP